jgi:hypothetical protein
MTGNFESIEAKVVTFFVVASEREREMRTKEEAGIRMVRYLRRLESFR